jgi:predicted negative regulator of RcsB-dependent stress response
MALDIKDDKELNEKYSKIFSKNKKNIFLYSFIFIVLYMATSFYFSQVQKKQLLASDLFQKVQLAQELKDIEFITNELKTSYSKTPYASRASIFLGNFYQKNKNFTLAKDCYIWAATYSPESTISSLANFQLSVMFLTLKDFDLSLKYALLIDEKGFSGLKNYILGDIYNYLGKKTDAIENYTNAYNFYENKNDLAKVIKAKIDALT